MDSLRKQMGTTVSYDNNNNNDDSKTPNKKESKKKTKKKKTLSKTTINENPSSIMDPDARSNNPYEQIACAIQRRDALLMAKTMGYSRQRQRQILQNNHNTFDDLWVHATDPNTKKTYYYNTKTRETRWDDPNINTNTNTNTNINTKIESNNKSISKNLPKDWKSANDSNGKEYYYNTKTKETTWNRPKS